MHHLPFVVDAGRAADEHLGTVAVFHDGTPLERNPVFISRVQVGGGVQVALL